MRAKTIIEYVINTGTDLILQIDYIHGTSVLFDH